MIIIHQDETINIEDLLGPDRTLVDYEFRHCNLTFPGPLLCGVAESDDPKAWRSDNGRFLANDIRAAPDFDGVLIIVKGDSSVLIEHNHIRGKSA